MIVWLLYGLLEMLRMCLAWRYARARRCEPGDAGAVTVLQPILSGDPELERCLRANAAGNPTAHFLWLVDEEDREGREAAGRAATPAVRVIVGPGPEDGENPKAAKLARALPLVATRVVAVVDDDTVIEGGELAKLAGALRHSDLATGLPLFASRGNVWERLVGGFVNGNALLTYFPAAAAGAQRTINGMIYAADAATLRALGGFAAIRSSLTDDFALASLYRQNGRQLFQAPVYVRVSVTIRGPRHCGQVMRRWMIFANRYFKENADARTLLLAGIPAMLPLAGLVAAAFQGPLVVAAWLVCLAARACANRWMLWRIAGFAGNAADVLFEVPAAVAMPLLWISALVRPDRLTWRSRNIDTRGGRIRYLAR